MASAVSWGGATAVYASPPVGKGGLHQPPRKTGEASQTTFVLAPQLPYYVRADLVHLGQHGTSGLGGLDGPRDFANRTAVANATIRAILATVPDGCGGCTPPGMF